MPIFDVPVSEIRQLVDPLTGSMWKCDPIDIEEVKSAIDGGIEVPLSWNEANGTIPSHLQRLFHIQRIATLVRSPPPENDPRGIILVITDEGSWFFDGNHRFAAEIVKGAATIRLKVVFVSESGASLANFLPGAMQAE